MENHDDKDCVNPGLKHPGDISEEGQKQLRRLSEESDDFKDFDPDKNFKPIKKNN